MSDAAQTSGIEDFVVGRRLADELGALGAEGLDVASVGVVRLR